MACVRLLRRLSPLCLHWHTPNGGKMEARRASRLKDLGVLPGVPDLLIMGLDGKPVFVEFKIRAGRQSPAQCAFQDEVEAMGLQYHIVRESLEMLALVVDLKDKGLIP